MIKHYRKAISVIAIMLLSSAFFTNPATADDCPDYFNHDVKKLRSDETINLCETVKGKAVLVVNTASHCGFTPQFKGLEALHQEYRDKGLVVLGFPSNDFRQEAKTEEETAKVCYINYGVTFTMLSPVTVKGADAHPLFKELARQTEAPGWNFNKYVVDASGQVKKHFGSSTGPASDVLREAIEQAL
jgi:glutathione peroxidase